MPKKLIDPYAEFQQPAQVAAADPYAEFQSPAPTPKPLVDTSNVAGAGAGGVPHLPNYSQSPAATSVLQPQRGFQALKPYLDTASPANVTAANVVKGALKSIPATMAGVTKLVPGASDAYQPLYDASQTHGLAQGIGKGVGDAAQFLIPGTGEEKLGLYGASKLPMLGKFAAPVAKLGAQALGSGTVNAAQGGSFAGGAAGGVASGLFGNALQKAAPVLAETALGVRATDRAYGRSPGQAIMEETTGTNPGKIAEEARDKMGLYGAQLMTDAKASPFFADLAPARNIADGAYNEALLQNEDSTIKGIGKLKGQLSHWSGAPGAGNVAPIPAQLSPETLLQLKRGVGSFRGSFNPATTPDAVDAAAGRVYHALDQELDRTVPTANGLNQRISSLQPVAKRAGAADLHAGVLQRPLGRFAKPTGALAGFVTGGAGGYEAGKQEGLGLPGAAAGAAMGLFAPEVISSPTTLMRAARAMNSPFTQRAVLPLARGAALAAVPKGKGLFDK